MGPISLHDARLRPKQDRIGRVLLVDDDPAVRRVLARLLRSAGFIVDVSESGEKALNLGNNYPYAAILTDLLMPGTDGIELIEALHTEADSTSYLLVTGASLQKFEERLDRLPDDVQILPKPWDARQLLDKTAQALEYWRHSYAPHGETIPEDKSLSILVLENPNRLKEHSLGNLAKSLNSLNRVGLASSIAAARLILEEEHFHAILFDLDLDDSQGLATIESLQDIASDTALIALRSDVDGADSDLALKAGILDEFTTGKGATPALLDRCLQFAVERKRVEAKHRSLALYDGLTGLVNRDQLQERLSLAIARGYPNKNYCALMFVGFDHFRAVNDRLGHKHGDYLLQQAALRLENCVRETDTVARLGGDQFAIILCDLHHAERGASLVAQRIVNSFATHFDVEDEKLLLSASVGIAIATERGERVDELLHKADSAMYQAKSEGRARFQFYDIGIHAQALERAAIENDLHQSHMIDQLVLHYQPQVSMPSGDICGYEALLRWNRPHHGMVPPLSFIPLLEQSDLIIPVGEWIIRESCEQLRRFQALTELPLTMAVNVSGRQLRSQRFVTAVKAILRDTGVEPSALELEITESVLLNDGASERLTELSELGVRLAIDDFGTGYSSLSYLAKFPINRLKIDKEFVQSMLSENKNEAIVKIVIALGDSLGFETLAEGVETDEQRMKLIELGCGAAQGYYFGRPMAVQQDLAPKRRVQLSWPATHLSAQIASSRGS